eukprot:13683913-Alexandrium_andersonii.AAC.1
MRSHSRAVRKDRPGGLGDGVLLGVVGLDGVGHLLAVGVQGRAGAQPGVLEDSGQRRGLGAHSAPSP